jgi:dihydroorotate dehydrogenase (fumarate)
VAAAADDVDGIAGAPGTEEGVPDTRTRFNYQVEPGQHIEDLYLVRNTGTTAQKVTVFATDAYNTETGGYGLLETVETPVDAGSWVTFEGGRARVELELASGASQLLRFSVDVPADASPGDHAAGIVVSALSPQGEILVDRRVATRLYVRVPGDLQPSLTIASIEAGYGFSLNPLDGSVDVTYTVRNAGNIALEGRVAIGVNTYFGIGAAPVLTQELTELLPGSSREFTVKVPGVGQIGYLNPYVRLLPAVDENSFDAGPLEETSRDTMAFAMPWWLLILLVVGLAVLLVIRLRRRADARNAVAWMEYTAEQARRTVEEEREPVAIGGGSGVGSSGDRDPA